MPTSLSPLRVSLVAVLLAATGAVAAGGCAPDSTDQDPEGDEHEHESPEPADQASEALTAGSVEKAAADGCSTGAVRKLSLQIIEEANCINPEAYVALPSRSNLSVNDNVFPYMEAPARSKLVAALDANPSRRMTINSMLRTVAQQYMLRKWDLQGRCGIKVASAPGRSNHETGLAIDINEYSSWKSALTQRGFRWLGSDDPVHFDYTGEGAEDHRGLDVQAFQRLWNRNHPEDLIAEDGDYGPDTERVLKKSPAAGFTKGAQCEENGEEPGGEPGGEEPGGEPSCDACATGPALPTSCNACVADVCAIDDFCCTTEWDGACVQAAGRTASCGCSG